MDLSNQNIVHIKKNGQEFIQFIRLLEYSDILTHAYSVGLDKNYRTFRSNKTPLPKEEYEKNFESYKTLCDVNDLNYENIIKANQAHTDIVKKVVEKEDSLNTIDTKEPSDGLITDKKNIILATTNADCILLLIFDPVKKVIANVHSGWKGTIQEISVKAIKKMQEEYGSDPKDIIVCICPSIRKCHFEVDREVYEIFYNKFKKLNNIDEFIQKDETKEKWHIDTVLINKIILMQAGVLKENIIDSGICSVCNKDIIHSFRAEGEGYGLSTAIIALK